ncbi:hypothetical protein ADL29_32875 [Streptomyces chattanoogensis]|uniref:Uncharacterized protein n=2 Tax=Streptomyces chattanoogensis TaxID=66876 RepID=A0A0N0GW74_9ACTN|nr:hypothetical protein ADL29_32875 [Streptomyces chattanoogensis]
MHSARLEMTARHLIERYTDAGRVTLWDLSVWHAAHTDDVAVLRRTTGLADRKDPDNSPGPGGPGEVWTYRRAPDETDTSFAARIRTGGPGPVDGVPGLRRIAAGDLVAALETGTGAPAPDDGGSVAVSGGPYPQ